MRLRPTRRAARPALPTPSPSPPLTRQQSLEEVRAVKTTVSMTINGSTQSHDVEPRLLLVHYIRELAGLTGTHVGCDTSQCGACTVHLNGMAGQECTPPAGPAAGRRDQHHRGEA